MDWGDLRYFVALARAGSLSGAARALGTEHTTVARRVAALEASLGRRLFDRSARGVSLTADGEGIAELAYRIEDQVFGIERLAEAGDTEQQGVVRLSAPPFFAVYYLMQHLAGLRARHPGVLLEVSGEQVAVSLSRREADIALRLVRPEGGTALARRIGTVAYGLYGAAAYLAATPPERRDYVGYDDSLDHVPQQRWVRTLAGDRPLVVRSNTQTILHRAVATGLGLGALPRFVGDGDPRLQRVPVDMPAATRDIWLLVHPDLARSPRVRLVLDHVAERVLADRRRLDPAD